MRRIPILAALVALAFLSLSLPAVAQWSADPLENLPIAKKAGEQVVPKIAARPDGGTWIGWYDNASGNYDVFVQRLDVEGIAQLADGGLPVSTHTQDSMVTDWDLISDAAGNAVLVFSDMRTGNLDVHAYKIGPGGEFLWGPDGIRISLLDDYDPAPHLCEASDGDIVIVWGRSPSTGYGKICMQRVSPAGVLRFAAPLDIAGDANETPGFPLVVPAENGNVIVSWLRNTRSFTSPRHIRARKFAPDGTGVWASHVSVFDATAVPIGYWTTLLPDGAGGAVFGWHRSISNQYNSCVQRLDAAGLELFPHNGAIVSTNSGLHHIDPAFAFRPATGEIFVVWNERNLTQSQWGIYVQKFTAAGARAWGDYGLEIEPVTTLYKALPRCATLADGMVALWMDEPTGYNQDRLRAIRLDGAGVSVWTNGILDVATSPSTKSRHPVTIDGAGTLETVWEDNRDGTPDLYAQNVNADGSLGPAPVPALLQSFAAVAVDEGVRLSWRFAADLPGGLRVLRREAGGAWGTAADGLAADSREGVWIDRGVRPETAYDYVLEFADGDGWFASAPVAVTTGRALFALRAPGPNPAAADVLVRWSLPAAGAARVAIYDARGRLVRVLRDGDAPAGAAEALWDRTDAGGHRVAAGTYFLRLDAAGRSARQRVVVLP